MNACARGHSTIHALDAHDAALGRFLAALGNPMRCEFSDDGMVAL